MVTAVDGGVARARLAGRLRMKHDFYPHRPDDNWVEADVVGTLEFEPATGRVRRLLLTTDGATYGRGGLDVAVRLVP